MNRKMLDRLKNYLKCAAIGPPPFWKARRAGRSNEQVSAQSSSLQRFRRADFRDAQRKKEKSILAASSPTCSFRDTVSHLMER
jgi:hypothetical protein